MARRIGKEDIIGQARVVAGMNEQSTNKPGFAEWFKRLVRNWRETSAPTKLVLTESKQPSPEASKRALDKPVSPPELLPGNYRKCEFFIAFTIDGVTHFGYPKEPLLDRGKTPPVIRWGSRADLSWPGPSKPRARWVDEPKNGVSGRTMATPEDLLGVEGMVGDQKYRFEKILEAGKNQVVYSLFCEEHQYRIAYGFSRDLFGAKNPPA
jgi:hypothetical protein